MQQLRQANNVSWSHSSRFGYLKIMRNASGICNECYCFPRRRAIDDSKQPTKEYNFYFMFKKSALATTVSRECQRPIDNITNRSNESRPARYSRLPTAGFAVDRCRGDSMSPSKKNAAMRKQTDGHASCLE